MENVPQTTGRIELRLAKLLADRCASHRERCETCLGYYCPSDIEAGECIWCIARGFKKQLEQANAKIVLLRDRLEQCATDDEVLELDDQPTSSGIHMTAEQKEPFYEQFRRRVLSVARSAID